jgi:hypothetical protein
MHAIVSIPRYKKEKELGRNIGGWVFKTESVPRLGNSSLSQ